jgi:hypothetical protein
MTSRTDEPEPLAETAVSATGRVVGLASESLHRFSKSARENLVLLEGWESKEMSMLGRSSVIDIWRGTECPTCARSI